MSASPPLAQGRTYWTFISYSHADARTAAWLHRALETYRIPHALVGRPSALGPIPRRLFPVFRDDAELAGSPSLASSIEAALTDSRSLIVVCSPDAAASPWVDREIRRFRELADGDRTFALLVAGEPGTSCPAALLEGGREPLAVDLRAGASQRRAAALKLVAGLLGRSYDDLARRDARRRRRGALILAGAAAAAALAAALGYLGLADNRNDVPYAQAIRSELDRRELSVFRRATSDAELRGRAVELRTALVRMLYDAGERTEFSWIFERHGVGVRDPWTAAQVSAGVFAAGGASSAQTAAFGRNLDLAFAHGQPLTDVRGALYGWKAVGSRTSTAEGTLWTALALELELADGRAGPARRRTILRELALVQSTARLFGPFPDGHFAEGPRQLGGYSTYATAMAYLALLAAREAHVGWDGSEARRETAIGRVRAFLLQHFGGFAGSQGWLPDDSPDAVGHTYEGLDEQIVSAFLRDERTGGAAVPARVGAALPAMMRALEVRRFDVQFSSAILAYRCLDEGGVTVSESRLVEFNWYQWAIAASAEWLHVLKRRRDPPRGEIVEARRVLRRLLIDDGSDMLRTILPEHNVWVSAETSYALGSVVTL